MLRFGWLLLLFLSACSYAPQSETYRLQYCHLKTSFTNAKQMQETPFFLIILVEARHLDYSNPRAFFKTLAKHPSDGSKNGDVGHAWIYLQGEINGKKVCLEGGHSGELGFTQPRYMEGVFKQYECGSDNPIAYLWESQKDGFFQRNSGHHYPTFAAKIDLNADQFHRILKFIDAYDFSDYSITGNQCCTFTAQIAAFAGLDLECEITIQVEQNLCIEGQKIVLWEDPTYSEISISSPDILERSLMLAVADGRAEYALSWYRRTHPYRKRYCIQDILRFPERYMRFKRL